MKNLNKAICVILSFVILLAVAGCGVSETASTVNSSAPSSSNDSSSISSSEPSSSAHSSSSNYTPPPNYGEQDFSAKDPFMNETDSSADKDDALQDTRPEQEELVDWAGPRGYVIVVPANNSAARESAQLLQDYFVATSGLTLEIVEDSEPATSKEIIVGKTNRKESIKNLKDSQMKVALNGKKLVFAAGHDVTLEKAVRIFTNNAPNHQKTYTFTETSDFTSTKNGYTYVWGDEFEAAKINPNKWSTIGTKMSGGGVLTLGNTEDVVGITNGNLRLTTYIDEKGEYHAPYSVHTQNTMNFLYGYVEIRTLIPNYVGNFASFWTRSISDKNCQLVKGKYVGKYFAEVDIFEVLQKNSAQHLAGNILKIAEDTTFMQTWCTAAMPHAQSVKVADGKYHLVAYEWSPDEIKFYLDDKLYARFDMRTDWVNGPELGKGKDGWSVNYSKKTQSAYFDNTGTGMDCFREAQYLIFNHHLHHEGAFKASTSVTKNKYFKKEDYLIDYVRIYQKSGQELYTK